MFFVPHSLLQADLSRIVSPSKVKLFYGVKVNKTRAPENNKTTAPENNKIPDLDITKPNTTLHPRVKFGPQNQ